MKTDRTKKLIFAIISIIVVCAINASVVMVTGVETENSLLEFVSKFSFSVSTVNIVDVVSCFGIYALLTYAFGDDKFKLVIPELISAVLLSFLYIWCFSYKLTQDTSALFDNPFQTYITIFRFLGYTVLFYAAIESFFKFLGSVNIKENNTSCKDVFIISSVVIFLGWLFWIVMAFPGTVACDGVTQLGQYYFDSVSAHHPPLSTWIMGVLFDIGKGITKNPRYGVFLYLFVQAIVGAVIIGYSIYTMARIGFGRIVCYAIAVFFAIIPIFGMFAQWYEKDLFYGLFTLLFLTKLITMCLDTENVSIKDCIILTVEGLLCVFLRNNGIYAVIPVMIVMAFLMKKKLIRRLLWGCSAFVIVVSIIVNGPVFNSMGIEKVNIREALSVPMQQSARYVKEYGGEVTEEEMAVLGTFFNDYYNLPEIYEPFCADSVKNTVFVQKENLGKYFLTWFKMGLKHPGVYFDAFMCLNYGYLSPIEQNAEANGDMPNQDMENVMSQLIEMGVDGSQDLDNIQILKSIIYVNMVFPLIRYLSMPGAYMWLTIILIAFFIRIRSRKGYVILIPNIINLLVCLASPLCNGMRYQLPVILSMPIMIAVTIYLINNSEKQK
ncbi:hypothetical protein SAMN02745229_02889 [Butyrivibrio fibrisolvens DSM 3071]|uniref:Uncharacterized protein n=1 Tax=Butyrivibrio fibrisolvens DSM 3071 TaxID=1121131 RepID=A0A1M6A5T4_BUTFI|nr:DUF6020 family protein [Butyrivibrio fibrisolvens]SHI31789.1 hypothetical protein SAMN02745229_02889 [Butyrivibrio fibrisolvens DSM 3071]